MAIRKATSKIPGEFVETPALVTTILELKAKGIRCVAAHPHVNGRTIAAVDLASDCCIVFGSEGYGLSPAILAACDEAASIPMPEGVDSLNVSSAAAVFLYEAGRQRAMEGSGARGTGVVSVVSK